MKWALRLWLVIFGIFIIWIYFLFISPKIFHNQIVTIPDVVDMNEEEAIAELERHKIKYQITYVENEKNSALKTVPYAGTNIKSNYVISLYIGKVMPVAYRSYLGRIYDDVSEEINVMCNTFGIKLRIEYEEVDSVVGGLIIKESLVDGSVINQGDELCLTLSSNHSSYMMPNFIGKTIEEALQWINEYQLKVNLTYIQTPVEEDIIIYQSTPANTLIHKNNPYTLDLYVSKGIQTTTVVDVDSFIEVLANLGYEIDIKYVNSNDLENKLVAFEVQKLYDSNVIKYILWITK